MSDRSDSDASFLNGLILGFVAGAGLVILLSPEVRERVTVFAQEQGFAPNAADMAATNTRAATLLAAVPPPADPLSSAEGA
jgi:hypothetical protein